jgi:hypothetical protein
LTATFKPVAIRHRDDQPDGTVNAPLSPGAFPWRFPLALRGDARFGDLAPCDDRPGTKRPIAG